jgi:hypothetical protein
MKFWLGVVAHVCNLSYSLGGGWRLGVVRGQLGQKVSKAHLNKQTWHGGMSL